MSTACRLPQAERSAQPVAVHAAAGGFTGGERVEELRCRARLRLWRRAIVRLH
jgi:hypothetical protein